MEKKKVLSRRAPPLNLNAPPGCISAPGMSSPQEPPERAPIDAAVEALLGDPQKAGLDNETRAWLAGAGPADFALALSLGARCLRAIPELSRQPADALWPPARSSAERGAAGESEIYELLRRAHGSRVRDVSRRAHSGDLICDSRAGPVLVEVKHYTNTVPSAEVDKFLRDLRERDAAAGVILS